MECPTCELEQATEIAQDSHEEAWRTACILAETLRGSDELDQLGPEQLLKRLFREFPCRLHPPRTLQYACTCSQEKSNQTLATLGRQELEAMIEAQGDIDVDCEFCGRRYHYDAVDIAALLSGAGPTIEGLH